MDAPSLRGNELVSPPSPPQRIDQLFHLVDEVLHLARVVPAIVPLHNMLTPFELLLV